jgi:hypothetical protein
MKKLELNFETNADQTGKMRFIQLERCDTVALYRRDRMDGKVFSYELFKIKVVKAGTKLPNGKVVEEDYEKYPTKHNFGVWAWEFKSLTIAVNNYNRVKQDCAIDDDLIATEREAVEVLDESDLVTIDRATGEVIPDMEETITINDNSLQVETTGKRGRKAAIRPEIVFPAVTFTMKDLLAVNVEWSQPLLYIKLQEAISTNKIMDLGNVPNPTGRGKPAKQYGLPVVTA